MEIRDPVHGPIRVSALEQRVIDHPLVQRLRGVRQLGFGDQAFPGATHTRFLHSIGTMHLAGLAFDAVSKDLDFIGKNEIQRLRKLLRLAALLHDVGHPPLSHSGERILPLASDLGLPDHSGRPATHEEMTLFLVSRGDLAALIDDVGHKEGIAARDVAAILSRDPNIEDPFIYRSVSLRPLLQNLIAGELDVDRMDYLLRDSYFTGVAYGRFDSDWLLSHLHAHREGGEVFPAISSDAVFTFEDFLLSRFHMFLMVYSHHKTLIYHRMLERFLDSCGTSIRIPAEPLEFAKCDDEWLWSRILASDNPWSKRIVSRKPLKRAIEVWDKDVERLLQRKEEIEALFPCPCEWVDSAVEFSKYFRGGKGAGGPRLLVKVAHSGKALPIEEYSDLFERMATRRRVLRIYGPEEEVHRIVEAVSKVIGK